MTADLNAMICQTASGRLLDGITETLSRKYLAKPSRPDIDKHSCLVLPVLDGLPKKALVAEY